MNDALTQRNQKIAACQAAAHYQHYATLQQDCAQRLQQVMLAHRHRLPAGPVLEIGCGTGFITEKLWQCFVSHPLEITDLSSEMLQFCQAQLPYHPEVSFSVRDAETLLSPNHYAAIVGGFVVQWFNDIQSTILHLVQQLQPNGILFLSFPTIHSFPEWRQACQQLQIPFTANLLPDPERLLSALPANAQILQAETHDLLTTHESVTAFFHDLKAIGAGTAQKQLPVSQLKRLIQHWTDQSADQDISQVGKIQVYYRVAFWAIQRV
jgi:malonyl-CoA O-methyltransferase